MRVIGQKTVRKMTTKRADTSENGSNRERRARLRTGRPPFRGAEGRTTGTAPVRARRPPEARQARDASLPRAAARSLPRGSPTARADPRRLPRRAAAIVRRGTSGPSFGGPIEPGQTTAGTTAERGGPPSKADGAGPTAARSRAERSGSRRIQVESCRKRAEFRPKAGQFGPETGRQGRIRVGRRKFGQGQKRDKSGPAWRPRLVDVAPPLPRSSPNQPCKTIEIGRKRKRRQRFPARRGSNGRAPAPRGEGRAPSPCCSGRAPS